MSDRDEEFEALIEQSSLGSSGSRQLRRRTSDAQAEIVRRIAELRNRMIHGTLEQRQQAGAALTDVLLDLGYTSQLATVSSSMSAPVAESPGLTNTANSETAMDVTEVEPGGQPDRRQAEARDIPAVATEEGTSGAPSNSTNAAIHRLEKTRRPGKPLRNAEIVEAPTNEKVVVPGSVVTIYFGDDESDIETFLLGGREYFSTTDLAVYSPESALGQTILGAGEGQTVTYTAPSGTVIKVTVVKVRPFES